MIGIASTVLHRCPSWSTETADDPRQHIPFSNTYFYSPYGLTSCDIVTLHEGPLSVTHLTKLRRFSPFVTFNENTCLYCSAMDVLLPWYNDYTKPKSWAAFIKKKWHRKTSAFSQQWIYLNAQRDLRNEVPSILVWGRRPPLGNGYRLC